MSSLSAPTPHTLVKDIYAIFDKPRAPDPTNLEALAVGIKDAVTSQLAELQAPRLRLSNIGQPDRKLWYILRGHPEDDSYKISSADYIKFLYGHIIEQIIIFLCREAGHTWTDNQKTVSVSGVKGHIDGVLDGEWPVDAKSASPFGFRKFRDDTLVDDDPFGYIAQISAYTQSLGKKEGAFVAFNKLTGELAVLIVDQMDQINAAERIKDVHAMMDKPVPPKHCYPPKSHGAEGSGNFVLQSGCAYCPYKFSCWSHANGGEGLRVFKYAKGLTYFTNVAKLPMVDELTDVILGKEPEDA